MHETKIHVRWAELDPYHHVNHATYLSYLEHARIAALAHIGSAMDRLSEQGLQFVVVEANVRFRAPATAGDELTVTTGITDIGASRVTWSQRITRGEELILEGDIHGAFINADGRPVRAPQEVKDGLARLAAT